MKKLSRSNHSAPRKLAMRSETVRILRQVSLHELRDARVAGGSYDNCDDSTYVPFTAFCD